MKYGHFFIAREGCKFMAWLIEGYEGLRSAVDRHAALRRRAKNY
jgi:hypothetical protein